MYTQEFCSIAHIFEPKERNFFSTLLNSLILFEPFPANRVFYKCYYIMAHHVLFVRRVQKNENFRSDQTECKLKWEFPLKAQPLLQHIGF